MSLRASSESRLRVILEDYEAAPIPIHVVYREGRRAPARVRAFVDFAVPRLRANAELGLDLRQKRQKREETPRG